MPAFDPERLARMLDVDLRAGHRIGIVLIEDERVGDAAEAVLHTLAALGASGCRIESLPTDARTLVRDLWRSAAETATERETLPLPDYMRWLAGLPADYGRALAEGRNRPEDDPLFRPGTLDCGHFLVPALRFGDVAVVAWSMRAKPRAGSTPPHGHLAAMAWLRDVFQARTVLTVDGQAAPGIAPSPF